MDEFLPGQQEMFGGAAPPPVTAADRAWARRRFGSAPLRAWRRGSLPLDDLLSWLDPRERPRARRVLLNMNYNSP